MKYVASAAALLLVVASQAQAQGGRPDARALLDRAAAYVKRFVSEFSNVVAEEDFRQDWQSGERRRLTSDFLLVRYPGTDGTWLAFRDVTAVNGRPVRDQQERLTQLFLEPFADAVRRAEEITREASRHSLVELGSLSSPLAILAWLQPYYQPQFIYRVGGVETKSGVTLRALQLEQIAVPPVNAAYVRVPPTRGVAWVDERTGRVVKTEAYLGLAPNTATVTTTFRHDEGLGIDVPAELRESRVRASAGRTRLGSPIDQFTGIATYGRFRRFAVRTDEAIDNPPTVTPR
jgi:hypothetical protein